MCSPGYSWAPTGIRVSSGVEREWKEGDWETDTQKERKLGREKERETLGSKLRGMLRAAEKKS